LPWHADRVRGWRKKLGSRGHPRSGAARARRGRQPITTTQFPQPPGMGESWDPELVRSAAALRLRSSLHYADGEVRSPDPHAMGTAVRSRARSALGRSEEVYGEDPFFNGTMAVAFIKGLQGDDPKYWQSLRCSSISWPTAMRIIATVQPQTSTSACLGVLFGALSHGLY